MVSQINHIFDRIIIQSTRNRSFEATKITTKHNNKIMNLMKHNTIHCLQCLSPRLTLFRKETNTPQTYSFISWAHHIRKIIYPTYVVNAYILGIVMNYEKNPITCSPMINFCKHLYKI